MSKTSKSQNKKVFFSSLAQFDKIIKMHILIWDLQFKGVSQRVQTFVKKYSKEGYNVMLKSVFMLNSALYAHRNIFVALLT